jgi:hypothetical protein
MNPLIAAISVAIALVAPLVASAQSQPVVIELYTSQGCSSCPPADVLLADLANRPDIIALALHVDYWDYIGWPDEFADPAFTQRQKAYAKAAGHRSVYTPQMIIGGRDHLVGAKPMELADLIGAHARLAPVANMTIQRDGPKLVVMAERNGSARLPNNMVLQLVRFDPLRTVDIERGENAGKTITYANIVTSWTPVGKWDGSAPLRVAIDLGGNSSPLAVILQAAGNGPIVAAAQLR